MRAWFELVGDERRLDRLDRWQDTLTLLGPMAQTAAAHVEPGVSAVISGLPLMSMPLEVREAIVRAAFDVLAPDGIYVQFTYGSKPQVTPEQMEKLGLKVEQTAYVLFNLPPARVHRFSRR